MEKLLSPEEVAEMIPGMSKALLAQMRYRGDGPPFYRPSPRVIVYSERAVSEWLAKRQETRTGEPVTA